MSNRKSRFSIVFMWAMIPLTVFGGLPRMGCICANGNHKFFCQRCHDSVSDGMCSCCHGKAASKSDRRRGLGDDMTCSGREQYACRKGGAAMASDRPCRPVLDSSVFVKSRKSSLDLDRAGHAPLFVAFEPLPPVVRSGFGDFDRTKLLPPPDLVITLGVLLI